MKLAFTVNSAEFSPTLVRRFGRCPYFLIFDTETRARRSLPNPSAEARGGAGTQAAQFLAEQGVGAVVSGDFGPNALTTLDAAGIELFSAQEEQVETLIEDFLAERLKHVTRNTDQQHQHGRHSHGGHGR